MENINSVQSSNTEFRLVLLIYHIMTKPRTSLVSLIRQKPKLLAAHAVDLEFSAPYQILCSNEE